MLLQVQIKALYFKNFHLKEIPTFQLVFIAKLCNGNKIRKILMWIIPFWKESKTFLDFFVQLWMGFVGCFNEFKKERVRVNLRSSFSHRFCSLTNLFDLFLSAFQKFRIYEQRAVDRTPFFCFFFLFLIVFFGLFHSFAGFAFIL